MPRLLKQNFDVPIDGPIDPVLSCPVAIAACAENAGVGAGLELRVATCPGGTSVRGGGITCTACGVLALVAARSTSS